MMNKECRMMKEKDAYDYFNIQHSLFVIHHSIDHNPYFQFI